MSNKLFLTLIISILSIGVGGLGYGVYDAIYGYHGPSPKEIQNLENLLPEGCKSHYVGSYGKIDDLVIIECDGKKVSAAYTYMQQYHGKYSEVDRAATYVIQ